jgi:hypothetical protein
VVQKNFGVGFATYNYKLDHGLVCTRIISVKPSEKINTGDPSFVVTVILKNRAAIGLFGKNASKFRVKWSKELPQLLRWPLDCCRRSKLYVIP